MGSRGQRFPVDWKMGSRLWPVLTGEGVGDRKSIFVKQREEFIIVIFGKIKEAN